MQGIGAALLTPGALAVIGAAFPPEERGKAFGTWAGAGALFGMIGPLVGGWLADAADWRWIFWINVPLAALTAAVTLAATPESRDPDARGLDWLGAVLAMSGLGRLCDEPAVAASDRRSPGAAADRGALRSRLTPLRRGEAADDAREDGQGGAGQDHDPEGGVEGVDGAGVEIGAGHDLAQQGAGVGAVGL